MGGPRSRSWDRARTLGEAPSPSLPTIPSKIAQLALPWSVRTTGSVRHVWAVVVAVLALGVSGCSGGSTGTRPTSGPAPGRPTALTVDGLAAPLGLDPSDVAFGWH